ncbi:MAG: FKBP-type peptidyl-prolyl cis-trans isomerase [Spirochaetaceae bacterium]|nr:FKBP-type peptidyl-prolyl cis-trans isomerase [Spirochaetaceae bacterium]
MNKKITAILVMLILTSTFLSAKGQVPEDAYEKGESLNNPGIYAKVETSAGMMIFQLDYIYTPLTVLNFINLAEKNFYNGLLFYRDIENYAIFTGDPENNGSSDEGYNFPMETGSRIKHDKPGVLSMDGVSGMSSSSRLFITRTADPVLDDKYAAFGELVEGNKTLAKLKRDDTIISIEIVRTGSGAQAFKTDNDEFVRLSKIAMDKQLESFNMENPEVVAAIETLGEGVQKTLTGIYYVITQEGNGEYAKAGETVSVHYTGKLIDGTVFDSSVYRGAPFEFMVGSQAVIIGWDESVMSMSVGEKRTVIIPPNLAYGNVQAGPIAPNSWLIFDIEFLEIK